MSKVETKIEAQLETLEWKIEDAKKRVFNATHKLRDAAENGVEEVSNMLEGTPCHLNFVDFMDGYVRDLTEAKAELTALIQQEAALKFLLK